MKHSNIAMDAAIDPATLSRILTGAHQRPAFETVVRITQATGHSVGWLFEEGGTFSPGEMSRLREAAAIIERATRE